jgi:hypothetical protein
VEETIVETQNITLSLRKDILLKVKLIAVRRQVSVSGLLVKALETLIEQEDAYVSAQRRHLQWLEESFDLGTAGQIVTQGASFMSEANQLQFLDTNIAIYAHDRSAGRKHSIAKSLLRELWETHSGCLSIQILQEFYVNITQKVRRPIRMECTPAWGR